MEKNSGEHKVIERKQTKIHYFVSGKENTEAILFLHPAFGDHRCFDNQIDFFSRNFCVITVDMLGHGLSVVGKSKEKMADTAAHVAAILELEQAPRAHIVGVSLGALLAQDFALKYPDKTRSLSILGGYSISKEQKEVAKSQRKEMFKWLFKMIFSMDAFRRYVATTTVTSLTEQANFYQSAKCFTRKSFTVMSGLDKIMVSREVQRAYPLLIMVGQKDIDLAKRIAEQWHAEESGSEFYVLDKAGHCANMDNPQLFNDILMRFIVKAE